MCNSSILIYIAQCQRQAERRQGKRSLNIVGAPLGKIGRAVEDENFNIVLRHYNIVLQRGQSRIVSPLPTQIVVGGRRR